MEAKAIAIIAGIVLLVAAFFGYGLYKERVGDKNGSNRVQVAWDADKIARQVVYEKRLTDLASQLAMTQKANEDIHALYDSRLAQAQADATVFAQRLRNATISLNTSNSALSKVGDLLGSATASQQDSAQRLGQLVSLVTAFHTECVKNDAQLDALVAQAMPQM